MVRSAAGSTLTTAGDARALQALVSRFKNRITEMKQAEMKEGKGHAVAALQRSVYAHHGEFIRGATEGESWVDDVQEGMKAMMTAEAAAAAPVIALSEDAKAATAAAQTLVSQPLSVLTQSLGVDVVGTGAELARDPRFLVHTSSRSTWTFAPAPWPCQERHPRPE